MCVCESKQTGFFGSLKDQSDRFSLLIHMMQKRLSFFPLNRESSVKKKMQCVCRTYVLYTYNSWHRSIYYYYYIVLGVV